MGCVEKIRLGQPIPRDSFLWGYINWRRARESAVENILKVYCYMLAAERENGDAVKDIDEDVASPSVSRYNAVFTRGSGKGVDGAWVNAIALKEQLARDSERAAEYLALVRPVWEGLSAQEQIALEECYMVDRLDNGWVDSVKNRLRIEKSQAYRLRRLGVEKMIMALDGASGDIPPGNL